MCGCLSRSRNWGPGLQPRHVPQPGIKLPTLCSLVCRPSLLNPLSHTSQGEIVIFLITKLS